ncbi:MAG: xanthine dehydrogenase family protein molybdopterin-binding subunit [Oligoflexia bacterium]|nr:xanthine dehydrogenase family protein molybdopterin-binding subunit [Oligoflexia bacterium]
MEFSFIGKSHLRVDGKEKITGSAKFVDDLDFGANLLYAEIVESPHAHALIVDIDISTALASPGVIKVITGKDFPYRFGLYMQDRYIFACERVRFVGEQVAAVIARDPVSAKRAAKLVRVKYQPLPAILNVEDALAAETTLLHPELENYQHVPWFFPAAGTNIAHLRKIRKHDAIDAIDAIDDTDAMFADADLVLEDRYTVPRYAHCAIECHGAIGLYDHAKRLTIWSASQSPHTQRNLFAQALAPLGLTHKDVRVIAPCVGGGFGGKAGVSMEILAAALATTVPGRPVKILWSRAQEFYNTYQRPGVVATIKMGVKRDGTITALEQNLYWDSGAYVEYGSNVVNAAGLSATGPYRIEKVKINSYAIYTNLPPGGPYRGFGYSEFIFGLESHINEVAKRLQIDPILLRKRNAIREGDQLAYGAKMNTNGLIEAIEKVEQEMDKMDKMDKIRPHSHPHSLSQSSNRCYGKGFALFWKAPAMPPNASSSAIIKFNEDASINILVSAVELGQGFFTVMAQIAAEVLQISMDKIRVETPDTDRNPYEWQTVASHITWSTGNAVFKAATDIRDQIFTLISREFQKDVKDVSDLYLFEESVRSHSNPHFKVAYQDFVISGISMPDGTFRGGPLLGRGSFMPEFSTAISDPETGQGGKPNVHYTVGASAAMIEIDKESGKITIPKVVLAIDCGKAINPQLVQGQVYGGMLQGLATVLYENMHFDESGRQLNANFTDYKIPTTLDIPEEIVAIIVESAQKDGPFGARGMGEHTMIPAAPIIANAVEDALGIRIRSMPITAEKIVAALKHNLNRDLGPEPYEPYEPYPRTEPRPLSEEALAAPIISGQ